MRFSLYGSVKKESEDNSLLITLNKEQIEKVQDILLKMFDDVLEVCEQNNISYFLGGGSALGAVRHKGFIPWDDDIDINIPRADIGKFIEAFIQENGDGYVIQTPAFTCNYPISLYKIRKKNTIMRGHDDIGLRDYGISIDLYPIENTFNNVIFRNIHGIGCLLIDYLLSCRKYYENRNELYRVFKHNHAVALRMKIRSMIGKALSIKDVGWWSKRTDAWHQLCKDNNSKYVVGCAGRLHFYGELYVRDELFTVRKEQFEGRTVNVSKNIEEYLRRNYGDWTVIPSEDEQEKHKLFEFSA